MAQIYRIEKIGSALEQLDWAIKLLIDHAAYLELPKINRRTDRERTGACGVQLQLAATRTVRQSGRILQPDKLTLAELAGAGLHADVHPR